MHTQIHTYCYCCTQTFLHLFLSWSLTPCTYRSRVCFTDLSAQMFVRLTNRLLSVGQMYKGAYTWKSVQKRVRVFLQRVSDLWKSTYRENLRTSAHEREFRDSADLLAHNDDWLIYRYRYPRASLLDLCTEWLGLCVWMPNKSQANRL